MSNAWVAQVGGDPRQRAREIGRAHSTFIATHALTALGGGIRDVVAQSWQRSSAAHVEDAGDPPVTLTDDDLTSYRSATRSRR